jgi:polysaccharide biosynthesis/export protein
MKSTKGLAAAIFLVSALAGSAYAQVVAEKATILSGGSSANSEYSIKPGDIVSLYVIRMPELSRDYTVTGEGAIEVPFLGQVNVLGKTSRDAAALVANGLRGDFLVDPQVTATVKPVLIAYRFYIQGAVRTPGVYNFEKPPSLLELISVAGGLSPTFGATAFIIHKVDPAKVDTPTADDGTPPVEYELKKANIHRLLRGEFSENLKVQPDDIVQIPAADVFFVSGEVKAPGSFALKEGTTLRQAISLAQGTSPKASPSKGIIFREDSNGQRKEIQVDVGDIMKGKDADIAILANDIIVIPSSKAKSIFIPIISAFGTTATYSLTNRAIVP